MGRAGPREANLDASQITDKERQGAFGPPDRACRNRRASFLVAPSWRARQALKDLTLDHLTNDRLHVCLCKRSQGLRANISKGATTQSKRGHGNVIWCLNNRDHVVLAQCPESIPHSRSALLRHFFEGVCPFW